MSRTATAAAITESKKASGAKPIWLAKLQFDSGTTRTWSGRGDITFGGEVYQGVGDLGSIGVVEESIEHKAFGITMRLTGIPAALLSVALSEDVQGRTAQVWLGFLDASYQLVADPVLAFQGRMDTMNPSLGETVTITITAESRLIDLHRARVRRYTAANQNERFPGDKGLEFVTEATEKEIFWGQPTPKNRLAA